MCTNDSHFSFDKSNWTKALNAEELSFLPIKSAYGESYFDVG
jgi:hypothetical protein